MNLPAHLYFYPDYNFSLYKKYVSTKVTITRTQKFYGWTYFGGKFHDGETFVMLPETFFSETDHLIDVEDLW